MLLKDKTGNRVSFAGKEGSETEIFDFGLPLGARGAVQLRTVYHCSKHKKTRGEYTQ